MSSTQNPKTLQHNATVSLILCVCIACLLLLVGCKPNDSTDDGSELGVTAPNASVDFPQFSSEIRSLSDDELSALGVKNDVPTEFVYPGAYLAQVVYPQRLLSVEHGDEVVDYFSKSSFQIPIDSLLANSSIAVASRGYTFEMLKDAKTGSDIQAGFPTPVEVVYLSSNESLDKEALFAEIYKNVEQEKIQTKKIGKYEVRIFEKPLLMQLDQTGSAIGKIDSICACVCFPTDNTAVFMSGTSTALENYFSDKDGDSRGIAAQRLGRADVKTASIVFQYDYDWEVAATQLVQLPIPVTQELMQSIQSNVSAFQIVFDASKEDGALVSLAANVKSSEGAGDLRKSIGTALMKSVDNIKKMTEQGGEQAANVTSLIDLLKTINLSAEQNVVSGSLKNSAEARKFFIDMIENLNDARDNGAIYAQYGAAEETLFQLSRLFTNYFGKNKTYPAAICDAAGNPLLSWRVTLLQVMGEQYQKLYEQFKLDEPWNSENNIKLLDQMPAIFASPFDPTLKNKTQYLVFNTPGTPFGNAVQGLKLQDVDDPSRTLSVVLAAPAHAVEWTRPETFAFNPQKPTETFGPFICAATLLGEVINSPCDDSEKFAKTIASYIYGVVDETSATSEAVQEENSPEASTSESSTDIEGTDESVVPSEE